MSEKSIVKNSFYNVIYKMLNVLFPLISATYASHILMASGMGKVSSAQNIVSYFVILAALGIPNYGIREIAGARNNVQKRNQIFSELFLINFISTILYTLFYFSLISVVSQFQSEIILYRWMGVSVLLNMFNIDWFYQGVEEFRYIARRSFLIKLLSLGALFLLVRRREDYVIYACINIMATAGNYLFNMIHLRKKGVRPDWHHLELKQHMKPILFLLSTTISIELYTLLDTTMLTFLCPAENVGYYANSMKVVKLLITLITAIGGVLLPRLSYYAGNGQLEKCHKLVNKVLSVMLFLFMPCGIGIMLTADHMVPVLFGASFVPAVRTMRLAALLVYALGFSNLFGTQVLLTFSEEKKLLYSTCAGAVSNIILNAVLIPLYSQNGATVASVISELIVTLMTFHYSRKYIHYHLEKGFLLVTLASTVLMSLVMMGFRMMLNLSGWMMLLCEVFLGIFIYMVVNVVLKNKILKEFVSIIHK